MTVECSECGGEYANRGFGQHNSHAHNGEAEAIEVAPTPDDAGGGEQVEASDDTPDPWEGLDDADDADGGGDPDPETGGDVNADDLEDDADDDADDVEIDDAGGEAKEYNCGNCGEQVEYLDKSCSSCGEKLMWSKIEA